MIVIIVTSEESEPKTYQYDSDLIRIGRASENDLVLANRTCSRHHAEIVKEDGAYKIVDLGSTNGIKFGSEKVQELDLEHGTIIGLGQYTLTISLPEQLSAETVALPIMSTIRPPVASRDSVTDVELETGRTQRLSLPVEDQVVQRQKTYLIWLRVALFLIASAAFVLAVMIALRYFTNSSHRSPAAILDAAAQNEPDTVADDRAGARVAVRVAPVKLDFAAGNTGDAPVMIPVEALSSELDNQAEVFVIRAGQARLVSVTIGRRLDDSVEVLQGLVPDDEVIVDRPADLRDGQSVMVIR
jgi:hypothetical protein